MKRSSHRFLPFFAALFLSLLLLIACDGTNAPQETSGSATSSDAVSSDAVSSEDLTAEAPEASDVDPDGETTAAEPEGTTAGATEETTARPAEPTDAPDDSTVKEPETTVKEPETTAKTPETTVKPATTTKAPETTARPAVTTKAPETTVKEPETTDPPEPPADEPSPADHIPEFGTLKLSMTELFRIPAYTDASGVSCTVVQGGCTDGTYYYVGLNSGVKTTDSISAVLKYELATGNLVATYEGVRASHCNDMVYNPDTHELFIVHNQPDREHISVFDPDTLEYRRTITIEHQGYGLSYDPYEQCYWLGISHGFTFAKLDLNFNTIALYSSPDTGYTHQGIDSDDKYVYLVKYNVNAIMVHRKDGTFVREITLPKSSPEAEHIFHVGDQLYVGYYDYASGKGGGILYSVDFETITNYGAQVTFSEEKTLPQFTGSDGVLYKTAQGACSDGTYLYAVLSNGNTSNFRSALHKIDLRTGEVVQILEGLQTGQTNDMTYNPNTNEILIATDNPDKTTVIILDAATLTVKKTTHLAFQIYAITYDPVKNCYWVGLSGTYDFACLDLNLTKIGSNYKGFDTSCAKQALECDGTYLYFIHSAANTLVVYKTDGTFVTRELLPERRNAAQSIALSNGRFYIGYNVANVGCVIYQAEIEIKTATSS